MTRLARDEAEIHQTFWRRPAHARPPGGESFADLVDRVSGFLDGFAPGHGGIGDDAVVVVTHAGPVRAALVRALKLDVERALSFAVAPLSVTVIDDIETDDGRRHSRVVMVNHLPARARESDHG